MPKKFTRKIEDFDCLKCGFHVIGNGFTNHCTNCLWGRHVDVNPGDRTATCLGMMEPIAVEGSTSGSTNSKKGRYSSYFIVHRCETCGFKRKNRIQKEDSEDAILALIKKAGDRLQRLS